MSDCAWVTLATNDTYCLGALVLAHSLKKVSTRHQLAIIITPHVSPSMREQLSKVFDLIHSVDVLDSQDAANLALLQRPDLGVTFTKIHCWNLTSYKKCVFLDADTLVMQNCDELMEREELSAAPDPGWPDCFNSGVFVFVPSQETFKQLIQFASTHGSFDGGDQGLLNMYFNDWPTSDIRKHLSFLYNMCSTSTYTYLPALKYYGANIKIVHFIGANKPWLLGPSGAGLSSFTQSWWDTFQSHVVQHLTKDMSGLAGALGSKEKSAIEEQWRKQNWEQGNIDFTGKDSFENIWQKIMEAVNKPKSDANKPISKEITSQTIPEKEKADIPAAEPSVLANMVMAMSEKAEGLLQGESAIAGLISSVVAPEQVGPPATAGLLMGMPALPAKASATEPAKAEEPSAIASLISSVVAELPKQEESVVTSLLMGMPALPATAPASEPPKPEESALASLVSATVAEPPNQGGSVTAGLLMGMPALPITPQATEPPKPEEPSAIASMVKAMSEKAESLLQGGSAIASLISSTVPESPKQDGSVTAGLLMGMPALPETPTKEEPKKEETSAIASMVAAISEIAESLPQDVSSITNLITSNIAEAPKQDVSTGVLSGMPALPTGPTTEGQSKIEESSGISSLISAAVTESPKQDGSAVAGLLMGMPAAPITSPAVEASAIAGLLSSTVTESPIKEGSATAGLLMGMPALPATPAADAPKKEEPSVIVGMVTAMSDKAESLLQGGTALSNLVSATVGKSAEEGSAPAAILMGMPALPPKSDIPKQEEQSALANLVAATVAESPKQEGSPTAGILTGMPALPTTPVVEVSKKGEPSAIASMVSAISEKAESLLQSGAAIAGLVSSVVGESPKQEESATAGVLMGMPAVSPKADDPKQEQSAIASLMSAAVGESPKKETASLLMGMPALPTTVGSEELKKEEPSAIASLLMGIQPKPEEQKKTESQELVADAGKKQTGPPSKQQAPQPPPKNGKQKKGQQPEPTLAHPLAETQISADSAPASQIPPTPPTSPNGNQTKLQEIQPGTPIVTAPTPPVSPLNLSKVEDPLTAQFKTEEATGTSAGEGEQPTPPKRKGKANEKQPQKAQNNGGKAKGKK